MGSMSGKAIATMFRESFRAKRVRPDGGYKHNWESHKIINWGNTERPNWFRPEKSHLWLNEHTTIERASNKLTAFKILSENNIRIPEFTTNRMLAENWCRDGHMVYCRTSLSGSKGKGIVIATNYKQLVYAPLYTKALPIRREYRVHIFNGNVIDYQKKCRVSELPEEEANLLVRNLDGGWVYCRNYTKRIEDNETVALDAMKALGLDFGAVDIVRGSDRHSYVLEVNTAPGLVGTTLVNYTNAIKGYLNAATY
jgi:hypothetical protein